MQQLPCVPTDDAAQDAPRGLQVVPPPPGVTVCAQRRTPAPSGTQGAPLQHWSANWQTWPASMQQPGRFASQPVGHCGVTGPPKQRMIPEESALHAECPWTPPPAGLPSAFR